MSLYSSLHHFCVHLPSIKLNLSIELTICKMSVSWRVFRFYTLAVCAQYPLKSCINNSVALVINTRASLVTIPVSSSKFIICLILLCGNCINLPINNHDCEVLTPHLLIILLGIYIFNLGIVAQIIIVLSFHMV